MWVDDLYAYDKLTKFMNGFRVASVSEWCNEANFFSGYILDLFSLRGAEKYQFTSTVNVSSILR